MSNPLLDKNFLKELDYYPHKFTWAKIVALNWEEYPIEEISGRITSGNINVDGSSAVRRTCSLSLVSQDININNFYWSLNSKFELYIGLENHINSKYPDIIWFKQGLFLISSFSCNVSTNNFTINIQGKDKMCLLNGDVGGVVPASWDFGTEDVTNEDGTISNNQIPIKDIVLQAVHEYAQEPWQNIIVNDLDDYGLELLEYNGTEPVYLAINRTTNEASNIFFVSQGKKCFVSDDYWDGKKRIHNKDINYNPSGKAKVKDRDDFLWYANEVLLTDIESLNGLHYNKLNDIDLNGTVTASADYLPARVKFGGINTKNWYSIVEVKKGDCIGYNLCDIIYPYDLIASPGEALTSILDKLVKMLGNFEYFYDVDGRFIFQKKKTYLDVSYNNIINEHSINSDVWADNSAFNSKYSYSFDDNILVSSIQNSPNLSNLKNDFSLWGSRDSTPIHLRYAIDKKPSYYKTFPNKKCGLFKESISTIEKSFFNNDSYIEGDICYISRHARINNIGNNDVSLWDLNNFDNWNETQKNNCLVTDLGTVLYNESCNWKRAFKEGTWVQCILTAKGNKIFEEINIDQNFEPTQKNKGKIIFDNGKYEKSFIYLTKEENNKYSFDDSYNYVKIVDWREIIYQMANDYRRHYRDKDFNITLRDNNIVNGVSYYPTGYTGYEKYYVDFEMNLSQGVVAYWRELYNPFAAGKTIKYKPNGDFDITDEGDFTYDKNGWNPDILNSPESLNFWFDFLDTSGELDKYKVCYIGQRSKAVNDDKIKSIYFKEIPNIVYYWQTLGEDEDGQSWVKPGYAYIQINDWDLFTLSDRGKSALDVIEEYLYSYSYPATAVTLTTAPIYYLTPNTLIYLNDSTTGAVGEYIMQKFQLQLGNSPTMSISAIETAKRIK